MERIYKFKNSKLKVVFGDITQSKTDVIVSSDDFMITMGGGVSAAIRRGAGQVVRDDIKKHVPAKLGDVIVTSAGALCCKYIFHIITISPNRWYSTSVVEQDTKFNRYVIENSINKSFRLLFSLDLDSISFPSIGAGVAKIPYEEVASFMIRSIAANLLRTNKSLEVELYLYDRYGKMTQLDFLPFFEKIGKYLPEENTIYEDDNILDMGEDISMEVKSEGIIKENTALFISYSRKDSEYADLICEVLSNYGISYWIDREGKYSGSNFKGVIVENLKKSSAVLFLSSKSSNESQNVIKEIGLAVHYSKPIIPIKLDSYSYDINIEYDLCNIDYLEYSSSKQFTVRLIDSIRWCLENQSGNI